MSRPLILVRGFGGSNVHGEQQSAYQGFNEGSVYPEKRGVNFIYEGFVLRAMKSKRYPYRDATNVVNYYGQEVAAVEESHAKGWPAALLKGTVVVDPFAADRVISGGVDNTLWVLRYYDLQERTIENYAEGLIKLVEIIAEGARRANATFRGVDVLAHSMGGLIVNEAIRSLAQGRGKGTIGDAEEAVHKIVTLGTPHRGIAFQYLSPAMTSLPFLRTLGNELKAFDPDSTRFLDLTDGKMFPVERILTVVGTNFRTYDTKAASWGNRVASILDEGSPTYNRSDGLVKQAAAQLPGAHRTFVHKCHGGHDSLVTSREAYEIAKRFFHASHKITLRLEEAKVTRGKDFFGKSEFYFGVSIKPRYYDFELFHQSAEAQNMYGPFCDDLLEDGPPCLNDELSKALSEQGDATGGWAGDRRVIWCGFVDASSTSTARSNELVFRVDVSVVERDAYGIGFSDNLVFRKQYYVQYVLRGQALFVHTTEEHLRSEIVPSIEELETLAGGGALAPVQQGYRADKGSFSFRIEGTGFAARLAVDIDEVENE